MKMRSGSEDEDYEQPSMVCGLFIHLYGNRDHGACHSVYFSTDLNGYGRFFRYIDYHKKNYLRNRRGRCPTVADKPCIECSGVYRSTNYKRKKVLGQNRDRNGSSVFLALCDPTG